MASGKLIVLEGIDGAGKSTQVKRLHDYLNAKAIPTTSHREPGGTTLGEAVREILLGYSHQETELGKEAEFLLFASARAELINSIVKPELENGSTVILDRFSASSIAYQGFGHQVDLEIIEQVNVFATSGLRPDKVIILDMDPGTALARLSGPADRFEKKGISFFEIVREGYAYYADKNEDIVSVLDGMMSEDEVYEQIIAEIESLFEINHSQG